MCVGVNLLVGTENGLMLLDRSGQGKVYNLINRRRFQQMDVLEGLNVLVTISGTVNYYLVDRVLCRDMICDHIITLYRLQAKRINSESITCHGSETGYFTMTPR